MHSVTAGRETAISEAEPLRRPEPPEISGLAILVALLRERGIIAGATVIAAAIGLALAWVVGPKYSANSTFLPQTSANKGARLANLAAQFGVSVDEGSRSESPDFYADLVRSRGLLSKAVMTKYSVGPPSGVRDSAHKTLIEIYGLEGKPRPKALELAVDRLAKNVSGRADARTGLVRVETTAKQPDLAVQINRRLLELVAEYNQQTRQSQASAERQFVQNQLQESQQQLQQAEGALQQFLQENRRYFDSPSLTFEHARLERQVSLQQQLYTSLVQSFQQARIEEVRNTPVITVVDSPDGSARKAGLGRAAALVLSAMVGFFIGLGIAITRQFLRAQRAHSTPEFEEFEQLRRSALGGLRPSHWLERSPGADQASR
jgi:uncharacterized protein involved in exopolysaccharide biosynthesis